MIWILCCVWSCFVCCDDFSMQCLQININGPDSHPLYRYLKKKIDRLEIGWDFVKFLIVDGEPVGKYHPDVKPKVIQQDLENILSKGSGDEL